MGHYDVSARTTAPPATVFAVLGDVPSYVDWQCVSAVERVPPGSSGGAAWVLHHDRSRTRLVVLEAVPEHRWAYRLEDVDIWSDYRAAVDLAPDSSGGTSIRWRGSFRPLLPGAHRFWATYTRLTMQQRVDDLAAVSARRGRVPRRQSS